VVVVEVEVEEEELELVVVAAGVVVVVVSGPVVVVVDGSVVVVDVLDVVVVGAAVTLKGAVVRALFGHCGPEASGLQPVTTWSGGLTWASDGTLKDVEKLPLLSALVVPTGVASKYRPTVPFGGQSLPTAKTSWPGGP
jgi:hypothetical protein